MNKTSVNIDEVEKFSKLAEEWWDENGQFRPLHRFNPVRVAYVKNQICEKLGIDHTQHEPLKGLKILDVGCGGGLLCEPMARMGAEVTGIDASQVNVKIAEQHAELSGLDIKYKNVLAEKLSEENKKFDVVLNMEVVEHVEDIEFFLKHCCQLVNDNGLMFIATINRTWKARALAIFMAENVLRWLPKGTHQFDKLVKPEEIENILKNEKMKVIEKTGVVYNPMQDIWKLSKDTDVNYMMLTRH